MITLDLHIDLQIFVSNNKLSLFVMHCVAYATRLNTSELANGRVGCVGLRVHESIERTAQYGTVIVAHVDLEVASRARHERG